MNDTDLADLADLGALVRDAVRDTHMTVPESDISRRARTLRTRRRLTVSGVAGAGLAAAAFAVTGFAFPATSPASQDSTEQLTAWTVAEQPSGAIDVTIRELKDPDGLQAKLRADGVPASVTFGHLNPACQTYRLPPGELVATKTGVMFDGLISPPTDPRDTVFTIYPAHLRHGEGIEISAHAGSPTTVELGVVHASPACTG